MTDPESLVLCGLCNGQSGLGIFGHEGSDVDHDIAADLQGIPQRGMSAKGFGQISDTGIRRA